MKWARLSSDPDLPEMTSKELNNFQVYQALRKIKGPDGPRIEGIIKGTKTTHIFNMWNRGGYSFPKSGFGRFAKEKYELFCGGWLAFYDDIVRNKTRDHIILFEWDRKLSKVMIYISPPCVDRPGKKYQDFIQYLPMAIDPPNTPPPPPPPRDL